jgi:organic hydroperoxide reductase OsmC/OhrA
MRPATEMPVHAPVGPPPSNETEAHAFAVTLDLEQDYRQAVHFGLSGAPPFLVDEPPPLGAGAGPNPARVLAAALGSCLGASLLFCLRRARLDPSALHTEVDGSLVRNERGRLRVGAVRVHLQPTLPAEQHERARRCVEVFEDFCVVTATVRAAVDVRVEVTLRAPAAAAP